MNRKHSRAERLRKHLHVVFQIGTTQTLYLGTILRDNVGDRIGRSQCVPPVVRNATVCMTNPGREAQRKTRNDDGTSHLVTLQDVVISNNGRIEWWAILNF